jgi:putative phosphoesterase
VEALRGSALILHAGDVGTPEVLEQLRVIAPTFAVRGNIDGGGWATVLPLTDVIEAGQLHLYMIHDLGGLDIDPAAAGFAAVISGHTHIPRAEVKSGVLYLNPGSAGPRRFSHPVAVARLQVHGHHLLHEIIEIGV